MTELRTALDQISQIHAQLARSETYRGYRAAPTALGAGIGMLAASFQNDIVRDGASYVEYWLLVASFAGLLGLTGSLRRIVRPESLGDRRRSLSALAQLFPTLGLGALLAVLLADKAPGLLPGLWSALWALGLWSSRPYLPRAIGVVALWFGLASLWLLAHSSPQIVPSARGMGLVFGAGQLALACVLWLRLERRDPQGAAARGSDPRSGVFESRNR